MSRGALRVFWLALTALLAVGCKSGSEPCTPRLGGATPFATLDQWCQVALVNGDIATMAGVTPYTLNTPLFSDYAVKRRTVWMPPGTSATYDTTNVFDFPDGTVFTKSFGFADDMRKAQPLLTWVETRVIWKNAGIWQGVAYTWDAAQKTATMNPGGEFVSLSWIDATGQTVSTSQYRVPDIPECEECHTNGGVFDPIGPKARNLNGDYSYPDGGSQNQLAFWTSTGILSGAPDPAVAPKLAVWNDPATGTLNDRARAYLESNCAHCHNPTGRALNTGLYLSTLETNPTNLGICKGPVAAGQGGCGLKYDVVPGDPNNSILHCRLASTVDPYKMPEIERSLVDTDGLALVTDWLNSLTGSCP